MGNANAPLGAATVGAAAATAPGAPNGSALAPVAVPQRGIGRHGPGAPQAGWNVELGATRASQKGHGLGLLSGAKVQPVVRCPVWA